MNYHSSIRTFVRKSIKPHEFFHLFKQKIDEILYSHSLRTHQTDAANVHAS
jgi:hypothetical protein